jgi:cytoskeleton protein RodZ
MTDVVDIAAADPAALHPGAVLREAREARRMTRDEVAQVLKLTPRQVAAIENEEFDLLPGATFARGFVRNYARMLGIDAAPLLRALDQRLTSGEVDLSPPSNAEGIMPAGSGAARVPRVLLVLLVLVVTALAAGLYLDRFPGTLPDWSLRGTAAPEDAAPAAASRPALAEDAPPAAPQAAAGISAEPAPAALASAAATDAGPPVAEPPAPPATVVLPAPAATKRLQFRVGGRESWIEVKDGKGQVLASKLNKPESGFTVEGQPPFALVIGNAGSVQVEYEGRPVDLAPHTSVSVARLRLE